MYEITPKVYMGLDCGRGMFLGKHVLSFTKPKVLGEKIASDN